MNQTNLKYQFARLNIAEKIIVINVVVFLLVRRGLGLDTTSAEIAGSVQ